MTIAFLANRHLTQPRWGLLPDEIFCPRTLQFKLSGVLALPKQRRAGRRKHKGVSICHLIIIGKVIVGMEFCPQLTFSLETIPADVKWRNFRIKE